MTDVRFNKILIWLNALIPLALLGYDAVRGQLGVNPVEFFLRTTGVLTLVFVLVTLSITPLRKITGNNQLIKYRRILGLFAFFYGTVHLTTYFVFDRGGSLSSTVSDVVQRPFILFGMLAFFLMIPLALTSTNASIKRLGGKRWQLLHRLIYVTAIAGVIHFWMIVKSDIRYPALFAFVLAALLLARIYHRQKSRMAKTQIAR
jgi:DMSO/TMAO reductase YedYZ heme-binding membrane subunit